ncbi:MAG: lipopolysaccharide biosynthesis protein [Gemmatimonadetes bacterium]|nr:lipopolysaccharide biosynthesis protein [Gemmatimonadota bacterium]
MNSLDDRADSINVVEVTRAVRRGWRALVICTVLGALGGLCVVLYAPRRFASSASVIVRAGSANGAGSVLSKLGLGDAVPGLAGVSSSPVETEMAVLSSRALVGQVVDSLDLQAAVTSPPATAARSVLRQLRLASAFRSVKYTVEHVSGQQYRFTSGDKSYPATAGAPVVLPEGSVVLRADTALPPKFTLRLDDREEAIRVAQAALGVSKTTGSDVVSVSFQASDSMTAAAVPNLLLADYLVRRRSVDRGTNANRAAFIGAQIDSVGKQLSMAEDSLRRFAEKTGMLQPEVQGKLQLDQAAELRKDIGTIDVERGALAQLTQQIASGQMTPRQLAAYPTFLKSPGINALLGQLVTIETERNQLLEKRLESDREVMALTASVRNVENQLTGLAASYKASLDRQRLDITAQLDTIRRVLGTYPGAVQSSGRLQRQAKTLAQTYTALQVQLVEARLGAIGEGGDVQPLDVATPSKNVVFPRRGLTMAIGTGAGLFVGIIMALFAGLLGRYVEDPQAIERTTGVPTLRLDAAVPLLVSGGSVTQTLLLVPVDGRVSTAGVAERLARTALSRGTEPTVLDLSGTAVSGSKALTTDVNATVRRHEQSEGMVIVRLPSLASDATAAALNPQRPVLLVAPPGRLERRVLLDAIQTLRRLDVPCVGVVVNRSSDAASV